MYTYSKYNLIAFLFSFSLLLVTLNGLAQIPSFPNAEGFGATTRGGRGGKVIKVTNLNDNGPGSLREAINTEGPRIVIFEVSGLINLRSHIDIKNPYITIAGQTAPGDGICIRGNSIRILTNNIVIRYLRVRPGEVSFGPENSWGSIDGISIGSVDAGDVHNVVLDHCSLSWAIDENLGIWGHSRNITVQYCIISEALQFSKHPKGPHSKGMLIGNFATNVSVHHNIFAHNHERNPLINGKSLVDIRNNVIYNSGRTATKIVNWDHGSKTQHVNFVGNYVIPGKSTINNWEVAVFGENKKGMKIFIANNVGPNISDYKQDNWFLVKEDETQTIAPESLRASSPFPFPSVTTYSPLEAYDVVLAEAGAILPIRDAADRKTVADIKSGKGIIINHKGGQFEWPPLVEGKPAADSDQDGIPDFWEERFGLDPLNPNDNNGDNDADGYTNIEEYINDTSPISPSNNTLNDVRTLTQDLPEFKIGLFQNYPNPFDSFTTVVFEIPKPADTQLLLLNQDGKTIKEFFNQFLYDGKYEIEVEASGLKPGVYLLVLVSNHYPKRIKIIHTGSQ